ncbi:MAG: VWA domain-containing protein [Colwellia sp.]
MKKSIQLLLCLSILGLASCAKDVAEQKKQAEPTVNTTKTSAREVIAVDEIKEKKQLLADKGSANFQHARVERTLITTNMMAPVGTAFYEQRVRLPLQHQEKYLHVAENSVKLVTDKPVSTFSIDVDTASYTNVRRLLNQGNLPPHDAVRVEEFINYFSYDYPKVTNEQPFSTFTEVAPSPFNDGKHLLHIGIQGKNVDAAHRSAANLVFLIDVSGSMNNANKLGLLKNSLKMLVKQLSEKDTVAIVVYAGAAGTVLEPTAGDNNFAIIDALARLSAGGSTNGDAGIQAAYNLAQKSFVQGGINRVILATDGDFNVGTVNQQALQNLIEQKRKSGISLSVLGFGMGNYNDALMQTLAQNGNGNAYYIDTLNEARKVLVEELTATLMTIAKDVKIQVEFNPETISEYRLIGYETRALKREDFNNDKIDAGEIGAGHTVTALYEVSFVDSENKMIDSLRYPKIKSQNSEVQQKDKINQNELAFLRLRYKLPNQNNSRLIEIVIEKSAVKPSFQASSNNFRFSAAVAGFGQILRGGHNLSTLDMKNVIEMAQNAKGDDKSGYRAEFINMVKLSDALSR